MNLQMYDFFFHSQSYFILKEEAFFLVWTQLLLSIKHYHKKQIRNHLNRLNGASVIPTLHFLHHISLDFKISREKWVRLYSNKSNTRNSPLVLVKLDHILWRNYFLVFQLMSSGCCALVIYRIFTWVVNYYKL